MALQGKVAFITGGARGLGRAFAEALLDRGAKVSLADINTKIGSQTENDLKSKYGDDRAVFNTCDVASLEDLRACYKSTLDTYGSLDVVLNNAGIMDEENFERMVDINFTSLVRSSYMAANHMNKENGGNGGIIINVSSAAGLFASPFVLAYTGVKHAVVGFSRSMAINVKDTDRFGLRVAALCPLFVETDMVKTEKIFVNRMSRSGYLTMPNMDESIKMAQQGMQKFPVMEPQRVVEGMLELISEPSSNGAVLRILPTGTSYVYPKKLRDKQCK